MQSLKNKKELREHLVMLTKELIRFPSHVDEMQKNFDIIDFIKSYFDKDNLHIKQYIFGGFPSIVITSEETKHPNIFLSGHADIIATGTNFTAEERDGKLFGTGAMDMKGGVACMMAVMKYFVSQKDMPSVGLMITTDEEVGGNNGTKALLSKEGYRCNFAIINEGRDEYDIVLLEKGRVDLKFIVRDQAAHSAYPWRTKNAAEVLMQFLLEVKKLFPKTNGDWSSVGTTTVLRAGTDNAPNVIPSKAEALFTIRLTEEARWTATEILERISKLAPENLEIKVVRSEGAARSDASHPYVQILKQVAEDVTKKKMKFAENHGGSDARFFGEARIPFAILGPAGYGHHSPDEYAHIDSYVTHFNVLKEFITTAPKTLQTPMEKLRKIS